MAEPVLDQWAAWLLRRRHGDDPAVLAQTLERLTVVRERVLANSGLCAGETLLDVGCGDGLIAFGGLERVGASGTVIFSDISDDLLEHDRDLAEEMGVRERCRFVQASADNLTPIADGSVDVVTTRSVLAYVGRKREAFREFARVLKPGGRISLYEPVNRLLYPEASHSFLGYDVTPVEELAIRVGSAYERRQSLATDPMFNYDDRDLLRFAEAAGFAERHLELHVDVSRCRPVDWKAFANGSPNPLAPTLHEAMDETLSVQEQERFVAHLRPLVERGEGTFAVAVAYLWATKGPGFAGATSAEPAG